MVRSRTKRQTDSSADQGKDAKSRGSADSAVTAPEGVLQSLQQVRTDMDELAHLFGACGREIAEAYIEQSQQAGRDDQAADDELERHRTELEQQKQQLAKLREQLEQEREELNKQAEAAAEAGPDGANQTISEEAKSLRTELKSLEEQMRQQQKTLLAQAEALREREADSKKPGKTRKGKRDDEDSHLPVDRMIPLIGGDDVATAKRRGKGGGAAAKLTTVLVYLVVLCLIAGGVAGWFYYQQMNEDLTGKVAAVQAVVEKMSVEAVLRASAGDAELSPRGHAMKIEAQWFDLLPVNSLVASDVPWMDVAPKEHANLLNPSKIVADGLTASFWYNPGRGIIRARVPRRLSEQATVDLYNQINDTKLTPHDVQW